MNVVTVYTEKFSKPALLLIGAIILKALANSK